MLGFFNTKLSAPKDTLPNLGNPSDDCQYHPLPTPLQLHPASPLHYKLALLVDRYIQETQGDRGPEQLGVYRHHWQWVLLGLAKSLFSHNWLLVSFRRCIWALYLDGYLARATVDVPPVTQSYKNKYCAGSHYNTLRRSAQVTASREQLI